MVGPFPPLLSAEAENPRKMYVVVREDLGPGLRAAQAAHAVAEVCLKYPEAAWKWHSDGNYLIVLGRTDLKELDSLHAILDAGLFPVHAFYEPDLNGEKTAFACLPQIEENYLFDALVLAYKPKRGWRGWLASRLDGL